MNIISYTYDREQITVGIIHIGVGNFHRAHQQFYINQLLADSDQQTWGICGICLLPSDQQIVENLRSQHLWYSLNIFGRDGKDECYSIGSLRSLIWGIKESAAVVEQIADPSIKIITLTITEGGYNLAKENGKFNLKDEKVQHDLAHPDEPSTIFGFVAAGLRKRLASNRGGLTILSCDNLQHNGNTAKEAFLTFMQAQDQELAQWARANVTFPNSMVDRITPATTPEDVSKLKKMNGLDDKAPIYCEDFCQWVIEDNFVAGRPALERVGVEFTKDVAVYENMKLSLLNASHILLSYPAFLKGYRKVDEAMQDDAIVRYVRQFMDIDVTPYVPAPPNTDLDTYKQTLLERFANKSVSDQVSRLCFDGVSKFPVYLMPNLAKMVHDQKDLSRVAFLFAAYRHYLKYQVDEKGNSFQIAEPWLTPADEKLIISNDPIDFLSLSAFQSVPLKTAAPFVSLFTSAVNNIKEKGISVALNSILH